MKFIKHSIAMILFIGAFSLLFAWASEVLEHKSLTEPWNMTLKVEGFYNEPEDSMDLMFFGSSHMYCSIDPVMLQEETGQTSYVFATQQQPLWITYYYMKEALKYQHPEKIFLEVHMASYEEEYADEGTNYSAIDPIPFSKNKLDMIYSAVPHGKRHEYIFNIIKYHSRWEELTDQDWDLSYKKERDPHRGYVRLTEATEDEDWDRIPVDVTGVTDEEEPIEKNIEYLNKIIALAEDEGIPLLMFKSPSNATPEEKKFYNYVGNLCAEKNIPFTDFNTHTEAIGLDILTDYYDRRHLNTQGVAKFLPYFCRHFSLTE